MKQSTARNLMIAGTVLFISTVTITYSDINREKLKLKRELESERKISVELTNSYNKLYEKYNKQIKFINEQENKINKLNEEIEKKNQTIESKDSKIHSLEQQLEKSQHDSESPMRQLDMELTFYTSGYESTQKKKGDKGYGITASGTVATEGRTVACPPSMGFGTKLYIDGFGYRVCEDRGGAITEGHIDVYVNDVSKAKQLGRQTRRVSIVKEGGK